MFTPKTHTPDSFWKWFEKKSTKLLRMTNNDFLKTVGNEIQKINLGIALEVASPSQSPREFIISADGVKSMFSTVEAVADAAPTLPAWKITRFRPRAEDYSGWEISWDNISASPSDMKFKAFHNGPLIDLIIYASWRTSDQGNRPDGPMYVMLDVALGEYDAVCGIDAINLVPLTEAPPHAQPWIELRDTFDRMFYKTKS